MFVVKSLTSKGNNIFILPTLEARKESLFAQNLSKLNQGQTEFNDALYLLAEGGFVFREARLPSKNPINQSNHHLINIQWFSTQIHNKLELFWVILLQE